MRMSVGAKLLLGFVAVIGISFVVGVVVIFNLMGVQANAADMSAKLLPEVSLANNLERNSFLLRYHIRGLGMDGADNFYQLGMEAVTAIRGNIQEAEDLVAKYPDLTILKAHMEEVKDYQDAYEAEIVRTKANTDAVNAGRVQLDEAAATFVQNIVEFLSDQNDALEREILNRASPAVLTERNNKVIWINTVIDLGNEVRIATQKAQLLNNPQLIADAVEKFQPAFGLLRQTLAVTRQANNIQHLNLVTESATKYLEEAQHIVKLYEEKEAVRVAREEVGNKLLAAVQEVSASGIANAVKGGETSMMQASNSMTMLVIGVLVSLVLGIIFALGLTRSITTPLKTVTELSRSVTLGDLNIEKVTSNSHDELGDLIRGFSEMIEAFQYKARILENIAGGDLRDDIQLASDKDGLGHSIRAMQNSLNEVLRQVNTAVIQMAAGSDQVSQASQNLSQGATEQAASLEEISASTSEVSGQSRQNAENAGTASQMARNAAESAKKGRNQMERLSQVMDQISKSGTETKKIVKAIDDIAFQVNLLALNANVEAARAGKYGKGFAVVAEEVRALAVRSAAAVKETTEMVESTITSIDEGTKNVHATNQQFGEIVEEASKVADLLEEIAAASQEQAKGMNQISTGLEQVDQVTQSNTASAEETASAAEELSGQAQQLKVMVGRFQLKGASGDGGHESHHLITHHAQAGKPKGIRPVEKQPAKSLPKAGPKNQEGQVEKPKPVIDLDDGDFSNF